MCDASGRYEAHGYVCGKPFTGGPVVTSNAIPCTIGQAVLGEGLRWDPRRGELLAVDILAGRVYRGLVADSGALSLIRDYQVPGTVGPSRRWTATRVGSWPPVKGSSICPQTVRYALWLNSPQRVRG